MYSSADRAASAQAWQLYRDGRRAEAAAVVRSRLTQRVDDGRDLQLQGLLWHDEGRTRAARAALESAMFLSPLEPDACLALAEIYERSGRRDEAQTALAALVERSDLSEALMPRVAALSGRLGDARVALELCRRALLRDPDCDEALFGAACYMRRLAFPNETIAGLLRRAVRLDPHCCLYRRTLANLLMSMNQSAEAYAHYRHVPLDQVCCAGCLRTMHEVFDRAGDATRRDAVADRLALITQQTNEQE